MNSTRARFHLFIFLFASLATCLPGTVLSEEAPRRLGPVGQRFAGSSAETPSFRRHVVPLLGRMGCSGRACHGSFQGQGGFQLSLFGYDFARDHRALVAGEEPRVDPADVEESLVLLKPTGLEKHGGKKLFDVDSWQARILRRWIQAGAIDDSQTTGEFLHLEVEPSEIIFTEPGQTRSLRVLAHWSDGRVEDVTEITRFRTNDDAVALVSEAGVVRAHAPGDTHVVAFYDNGVTPVPTLFPVSELTGDAYPEVVTRTRVDELIVGKLAKLGIVPSGTVDDAGFLRRVSLDVTGSLPTPAEVEAFIADRTPDKRRRKIEELLESPAHAAWWTTRLCDITGNNPRNQGENLFRDQFARQWYDWIYKRVLENRPYDEIIEGIVLATGRREGQSYEDYALEMSSYLRDESPANFADRPDLPHYWSRRNLRKPEEKALHFSYAFLGVRLQCAQCHKHPFDQWSQEDFQHFQAFFEPIQYGHDRQRDQSAFLAVQKDFGASLGMEMGMNGPDMRKMSADEKRKTRKQLEEEFKRRVAAGESAPWKEVYVQRSRLYDPEKIAREKEKRRKRPRKSRRGAGRVITPRILGGEQVITARYADSREPLMEWLRDEDNPYFARALVNRVWAHYFGRGLIDPPDDLNLANPPVNEPLMDHLARGFVKSDFDLRWLHREILTSDTYQRSWRPTETGRKDRKNFSHALLRRVPAEVALDMIEEATANEATRLAMRADVERRATGPSSSAYRDRRKGYGLTVFGKPARETTCDCERSADPTLLQTIYLRNDDDIWSKIDRRDGWLAELARQEGVPLSAGKSRARGQRAGKDGDREARIARTRQAIRNLREATDPEKMALRQRLERRLRELEKTDRRGRGSGNSSRRRRERNEETAKLPEPASLVREIFLRTLSRPPSSTELACGVEDLEKAGSLTEGCRDLLWALINTREFILNH